MFGHFSWNLKFMLLMCICNVFVTCLGVSSFCSLVLKFRHESGHGVVRKQAL